MGISANQSCASKLSILHRELTAGVRAGAVQDEPDPGGRARGGRHRLQGRTQAGPFIHDRTFIHVVPSVYLRGTVRLFTCYQFSMSVYYRGINLELLSARGG